MFFRLSLMHPRCSRRYSSGMMSPAPRPLPRLISGHVDWLMAVRRNRTVALTRLSFRRPPHIDVVRYRSDVVERPTLFSCRYKIPHQHGMSLADVFGHFEAAKAKVRCAIYVRCAVNLEMLR